MSQSKHQGFEASLNLSLPSAHNPSILGSPHSPILFRYCFEIDRVVRREDSHTITIQPSQLSTNGIAMFKKEQIILALEKDQINKLESQCLKYWDQRLQSWLEVPEDLEIDSNSLSDLDQPAFIELLIREVPRELQKRGALHIQNSLIREPPTKVQELEREVLFLRERMAKLESVVQGLFINSGPSPLLQDRATDISLNQHQLGNLDQLELSRLQSVSMTMAAQGLARGQPHVFDSAPAATDRSRGVPAGTQNFAHGGNFSISRQSSANEANVLINELSRKMHSQRGSDSAQDGLVQVMLQQQRVLAGVGEESSNDVGHDEESYQSAEQDQMMVQKQRSSHNKSYSYYKQMSEEKAQLSDQSISSKRSLDMVFLYSDPLMLRKDGRLLAVTQPLDTENEIREIQRFISQEQKCFVIRKEAANFEVLKQVLVKRPKIIHISCHGDYDDEDKEYYLALEEKDKGIMDRFTETRLQRLLGENSSNSVQLVFVSACHSEMIGKIFQRAKIPVVVAVNQHTQIMDEVCQLFSRHFYNFLIDGLSPKLAFEEASKVVQGSNIEKYSCCCAHDHKKNCKWTKYAMQHGYEKAHELHAPTCICNLDQNYHKSHCAFLSNFNAELAKFEECDLFSVDLDCDDMIMPEMSMDPKTRVPLCCCQPHLPHDESIKFVLTGEDNALNSAMFSNRKEGTVVIENDVNEINRLPQIIDNQMLVGRNKEIQEIVAHLFSNDNQKRLIHIYGGEGVGKSSIAKYAAKYTLERRKFPEGAFHIEIENRNSGQGIISKICQKLHIENCNKEQLCEMIKTNNILIIIDKCKKIIVENKQNFNKTIKFLMENTKYMKMVVVSRLKEDIDQSFIFKLPIEIKDLTRLNAAKLLLTACGTFDSMKRYKNPHELQKHEIFDHISFKPSGILQLAPLLREKDLDEINQQIQSEKELSKEDDLMQSQQQFQSEFGQFYFILNLNYRELSRKWVSCELNLLFLMCQTQVGLCEFDVETICNEKPHLYGDWKTFLKEISEGEGGIQKLKKEQSAKDHLESLFAESGTKKVKGLRLITYSFSTELQEYSYVPQPIVSEYINSLVLKQDQKKTCFQEYMRYFAKFSRKLVRSIKQQRNRETDLQIVSSEIDFGLWSDSMTSSFIDLKDLEYQMVYCPEIRFNYNEGNFIGLLNLDTLKQFFQRLDYKNVFCQYLDELCINVPSILIMLARYEEASSLIERCKKICSDYELKFIKGKLMLMQSSLKIKWDEKNPYELSSCLKHSENIMRELELDEGIAECFFLKALHCIKNFKQGRYEGKVNSMYSRDHRLDRLSSELQHPHNHPSFHTTGSDRQQPADQKMHSFNRNNSFFNTSQRQQQSLIEQILSELSRARSFFKKVSSEFGLAKTNLVEAEFQIETLYESGILVEYDAVRIKNMLDDSLMLFKKIRSSHLQARCLRNLTELELQTNGDLMAAQKHIQDALKILKGINDQEQVTICTQVLNKVLDEIRKNSHNVFLFAKAFPIVQRVGDNQYQHVGTFTRYSNDFRKRLLDQIKAQKKVVNLKFDVLNREIIEYIKNFGCRVLHLSSDVYMPDKLCIEGENGEVEYITISELHQLLEPRHGRLNVDVVVIAIPESLQIARVFSNLGVPHVIGFDFKPQLINSFLDNVYTRPRRYDYIYDFCIEFYKNLLLQKTVMHSFKEALPIIKEKLWKLTDEIVQKYGREGQEWKEYGRGAILFPVEKKHNYKIFDNENDDIRYVLRQGQYIDSSKVRGPTNVRKMSTPYTGRQIELHNVMRALINTSKYRIINVFGLDGIGRTRFAQEVAYYLSARYKFMDGIFMFDVKKLKQVEQLKSKMKEFIQTIGGPPGVGTSGGSGGKENESKELLLIFDNLDSILKHNQTQFEWWVLGLLKRQNKLKLIFNTKKHMQEKEQNKLMKFIYYQKLRPLNDIEAADMILTNCQRHITNEELQNETSMNIHQLLQQESSVKKCYGFPKYLGIFANYLEYHSFDKIDIQNYIPSDKQGQMKRLQREDQRSHTLNEAALGSHQHDMLPPKKRGTKYTNKVEAGSIQEELEEHENSENLVQYKRMKKSHMNVEEEDKVNVDELLNDEEKNQLSDDLYFSSHLLSAKQSRRRTTGKGSNAQDASDEEANLGAFCVTTNNEGKMKYQQIQNPNQVQQIPTSTASYGEMLAASNKTPEPATADPLRHNFNNMFQPMGNQPPNPMTFHNMFQSMTASQFNNLNQLEFNMDARMDGEAEVGLLFPMKMISQRSFQQELPSQAQHERRSRSGSNAEISQFRSSQIGVSQMQESQDFNHEQFLQKQQMWSKRIQEDVSEEQKSSFRMISEEERKFQGINLHEQEEEMSEEYNPEDYVAAGTESQLPDLELARRFTLGEVQELTQEIKDKSVQLDQLQNEQFDFPVLKKVSKAEGSVASFGTSSSGQKQQQRARQREFEVPQPPKQKGKGGGEGVTSGKQARKYQKVTMNKFQLRQEEKAEQKKMHKRNKKDKDRERRYEKLDKMSGTNLGKEEDREASRDSWEESEEEEEEAVRTKKKNRKH